MLLSFKKNKNKYLKNSLKFIFLFITLFNLNLNTGSEISSTKNQNNENYLYQSSNFLDINFRAQFLVPEIAEAQVTINRSRGQAANAHNQKLKEDRELTNDDKSFFSRLGSAVGEALVSVVSGIFDLLARPAATLFFMINGLILFISGVFLNATVWATVIKMSDVINANTGGVSFVLSAWEVIRDLINIFFIFGLIYTAINIMLFNLNSTNQRQLVRIMVAALLINFSFFFTSLAIDISNKITLEIYTGMGRCAEIGAGSGWDDFTGGGLSTCFMNNLGLSTAFAGSSSTLTNVFDNVVGAMTQESYVTIFNAIFMLIAAFVFFIVSFTLIARFVTLIFLLITSPVMFLSFILPSFSNLTSIWVSKLYGNVLYAPILFLFIAISSSFLETIKTTLAITTTGGSLASFGTEKTGDGINIFFGYVLAIAFIMGSVIAAKKASAAGGFGGAFKTFSQKAGNMTFGSSAAMLRGTAGRAGRAITQMEGLKESARKGNVLSKATLKFSDKAANSSFDTRNLGGKVGVAAALKAQNIDVGRVNKDISEKGFNASVANSAKKSEEKRLNRNKLYGIEEDDEDKAIDAVKKARDAEKNKNVSESQQTATEKTREIIEDDSISSVDAASKVKELNGGSSNSDMSKLAQPIEKMSNQIGGFVNQMRSDEKTRKDEVVKKELESKDVKRPETADSSTYSSRERTPDNTERIASLLTDIKKQDTKISERSNKQLATNVYNSGFSGTSGKVKKAFDYVTGRNVSEIERIKQKLDKKMKGAEKEKDGISKKDFEELKNQLKDLKSDSD